MARAVFTDIPPSEDAEDGAAEPRVRRKPIIKGGATSSKYISAATQGGSDRTYQEIFVDQIQDSRIKDRIDINEASGVTASRSRSMCAWFRGINPMRSLSVAVA